MPCGGVTGWESMYELIQHTADIRMRVTGGSREDLFREALRGLTAILEPVAITGRTLRASVDLASPDATTLLVDFLSDALTMAHLKRAAFDDVEFTELTDTRAVAVLLGVEADDFGEDVKAVTYHDAHVEEREGIWSTMLVFDI